MKDFLNIALIQSDLIWEDATGNRKAFDKKINSIEDADLVVLPEMFTTGFSMHPDRHYEEMTGDTVSWMNEKAREKGFAITGSLIIKDKNYFYNRLIFAKPDGTIYTYDKRHLFRMANEHKHYTAGNERIIVDIEGWKICPLTCYDLRFPVWSRNNYDYDLLIYIANWPQGRSEQWKALLNARAIENQSYLLAVNRIGVDGNNISYSGDSQIISPIGKIISETNPHSEITLKAKLDSSKLISYREHFPVMKDADSFKLD